LKIGIPALLFVAVSAAICYTVVSFLMGRELKGATQRIEKDFPVSSFSRANSEAR